MSLLSTKSPVINIDIRETSHYTSRSMVIADIHTEYSQSERKVENVEYVGEWTEIGTDSSQKRDKGNLRN